MTPNLKFNPFKLGVVFYIVRLIKRIMARMAITNADRIPAIFKPFSASQVLDLHFPSFQATRVQFQDQVRSSFRHYSQCYYRHLLSIYHFDLMVVFTFRRLVCILFCIFIFCSHTYTPPVNLLSLA